MSHVLTNKKALIALAIAVTFVAIVVPTCRMVGCSMSAMPLGNMDTPSFWGVCGGIYVTNTAPNAVVPSSADSLSLALMSLVAAALAVFRPVVAPALVAERAFDPPPPPEDPRGMRQLI